MFSARAQLTGCLALSFSFAGYCLFTLLHVLTEAFLLDLTAHFFRRNHYSTVFDWDCKSSREFNGLFLLRALGCPKLVFHWSAAWFSWPPLWWGVISFQNFRTLKLGLYFCVDFLASSELIRHLDLTDSYEIWPKRFLVINAQKCVRLCWFSKYFFFYALSCDEDRQIFNSLTSKYIFSVTNRNIEKASHTFVVYQLLIDTVQFVWSYVPAGRQVIQFSK